MKKIFSLKGDKTLWYVIIFLMVASVMVVYSSTGTLAHSKYGGNTSHFLIKQLYLLFGCLVVLITVQSIHYKYFLSLSFFVLAGALLLLIVVQADIPGITMEVNGTKRWIRLPIVGLTFQPSELAKLGVIMYMARLISFYQGDYFCDNEILKKASVFVCPVVFLIFMENFSTAALLGTVCLLMLFIGRLRLKTIFAIVGVFVGALTLMMVLAFTVPQVGEIGRIATIKARLIEFVCPDAEGSSDSFQSDQSMIAVAQGGLTGLGPGNSIQRNYLPHPYSDFIYAIIIEEYGLIGGGVIMLLYLIILFRVGVIVRRCTRMFPALLVAGLGLLTVFQALINMGVCVGLIPVTGQPLPLVSMGGTSLLFTSAAFGMMLSVSYTFSEEGEREALLRLERKKEKGMQKIRNREEQVFQTDR